jgi:phenylpropionate dioxygenase-like ring-hydroxylating dioxygenase large terminal subunit
MASALSDRDPDSDWSLPGWIYRDPEYFALEQRRILRPSWQVLCHESDISNPGDYHLLDFIGESVMAIRGRDGLVRAFANVCRHRGARLLDGPKGSCGKIVCPYHAWTYELDGRLFGLPLKETYDFDQSQHGLAPVETEVFQGFIFIRLANDGGPSVAAMMRPYLDEILPYRFPELRAMGRVTLRPRPVNWKNIGDNYSDGLHIAVAHPGLKRLMGNGYGVEAGEWVDKMWGPIRAEPSANFSERAYQRILPQVPYLPPERQRLWTYFKLWPNVAFDIYPDQVDFMQFLPISPTETLIREISYAIPDERREMQAARYLNWRINRQVNAEDTVLVKRVQDGMNSTSFSVGPLSRNEVSLRHFAARVRSLIPEARLHQPPAPGWSRNHV